MMKENARARTILITGGAGFVGSNLAARLLAEPGTEVRVLDNLARKGVHHNLTWLRTLPGAGERLQFIEADVCDFAAVRAAVRDCTEIYHLAAQVAVTTSIDDPRTDFETNMLGTFHVLEAARLSGKRPYLLFTSTNKVYGSLHGVPVHVEGRRYVANDPAFHGVAESEPLDFHSPYGCSKGAADQYVRDYARIYDLPTTVFRMSCIAGPRQFGNEDQGWVAHFLYSALEAKPITVYGDGFQVRDVLHVSDLVEAIVGAHAHQAITGGQIYNLGGGMERAVSIVETLDAISDETGCSLAVERGDVRPGDQPLYIADTGLLTAHTGWSATRSWPEILRSIHMFWKQNRTLISGERTVLLNKRAEQEALGCAVAEEVR